MGVESRVGRVARRLRAASANYDASLLRVALRAGRLRMRGWHLGDMSAAGLLDPRVDPSSLGWAVVPREMERLQEALNPAEFVPLCEDKRLFADACARAGLPTPPLAAVLERGADDDETAARWAALLGERAPAELVVKPADGHRGIGVRVLTRIPGGVVDHAGRSAGWDELAAALVAERRWRAFVVQARLRPHPELRRMTGSDALQTVRVMTLAEGDEPPRILSAGIRLAVGDQPIDSFHGGSTGNLWSYIDEDGTLTTPLTVGEGGFGYVHVPRHPTTGLEIAGLRAPEWDGIAELALRAADAFRMLTAVGWDIAATPGDLVITEGNAWWALLDCDGPIAKVADALRAAIARA